MENGKQKKEGFIEISDEETEDYAEELNSDEQKKWESSGYYGENPRPLNDEEMKNFKTFQENLRKKSAWKPSPTSIRLPSELEDNLKKYADKNGLGYHAVIKMILTRFINEEKNKNNIAS